MRVWVCVVRENAVFMNVCRNHPETKEDEISFVCKRITASIVLNFISHYTENFWSIEWDSSAYSTLLIILFTCDRLWIDSRYFLVFQFIVIVQLLVCYNEESDQILWLIKIIYSIRCHSKTIESPWKMSFLVILRHVKFSIF